MHVVIVLFDRSPKHDKALFVVQVLKHCLHQSQKGGCGVAKAKWHCFELVKAVR